MLLAHKTKLYPNNKQATYFRRACGIRRSAYNWALHNSRQLYEQGVKTSGYDLSKRYNAIKHEQFPWTSEVTKWAPEKAVQDAFDALKRWWKGLAQAPVFKKKGKAKDSFHVGGRNFSIKGRYLRIDKCGHIRMAQCLRLNGKVKFVTISREADEWFVSITVDLDDDFVYPHECETQASVGIDVGITRLVTLSNGKYLDNPRHLRNQEEKIKQLQRKLSKKQKGSNNHKRAKIKLAKAHRNLRNARHDFLHKLTTYLVTNFKIIGIEDLNVKGLLKNHKLAKHIADAAFYEFRRQLEYKAKLAGCTVVVVSRWFASSKTCSRCGHKVHDLKLSDRTFICPECGLRINRDRNAAINIRVEALKIWREALATVRDHKTDESLDYSADRRRRKSSSLPTERLVA